MTETKDAKPRKVEPKPDTTPVRGALWPQPRWDEDKDNGD